MRMLRSIYNRGVEAGSAPYIPRLFHDVYTGVDVRQKKALPVTELRKLLYEDPQSERLRHTQAIACLLYTSSSRQTYDNRVLNELRTSRWRKPCLLSSD